MCDKLYILVFSLVLSGLGVVICTINDFFIIIIIKEQSTIWGSVVVFLPLCTVLNINTVQHVRHFGSNLFLRKSKNPLNGKKG
jgi:hypothetical protein